ncbi:polyprenyl synthetase family protein [Isoalcanivorax beigongshangi]|uniref:Polyprenyl synthetase family protein n=1 Tax=Isoalcanivorax beigongshangi TaxID=3238810 RepID=A0ABV4ADZ8_9GAMM
MTRAADDLSSFIAQCRDRFQTALEFALPLEHGAAPRLMEAMRYAALGGGKRLRPLLAYAACQACGGKLSQADIPAVAVELVHAYSLVHDDLPAMDDDSLRRGQPTCHIAFDEATAILAGDSLQTRAFELLANSGDYKDGQRLEMIRALSHGAGVSGMAAGQMRDIEAEGRALTLEELERIHYLKTGRLITAALLMGAIAADAPAEMQDTLARFGDLIGLAFQIQDDILDVTSTADVLGKPSGSDARHGKSTFPALLGLDASRDRAQALCREAHQLLDGIAEGRNTGPLRDLADYIVGRSH